MFLFCGTIFMRLTEKVKHAVRLQNTLPTIYNIAFETVLSPTIGIFRRMQQLNRCLKEYVLSHATVNRGLHDTFFRINLASLCYSVSLRGYIDVL